MVSRAAQELQSHTCVQQSSATFLRFVKSMKTGRLEIGRRLSSDETDIQAEPDMGVIKKYRENRLKNSPTLVTIYRGSSQLLLWYGVCISGLGMGDCYVLEGRLNRRGYIGTVEEKFLPFITRVLTNGNFSFQQHNAPCHTAHTVELLFTSMLQL